MIFNIAFDSLVAAAEAFTRHRSNLHGTLSDGSETVDTSGVVDTTMFQSPQDSESFRNNHPKEWMVIASTPPKHLKDHQKDAANEMKELDDKESELKATQLAYRESRTKLGKDRDEKKAVMEKATQEYNTAVNLYNSNDKDDSENTEQLSKIQEQKILCVKKASLSDFMAPGSNKDGELTRGGLQDLQNKLGLHSIADVVKTVSEVASASCISHFMAAMSVVYWLVNLKINENSSVTNKVTTGHANHSTATVIMKITAALGMEGTLVDVLALLDQIKTEPQPVLSIADAAPATHERGKKRPAASISVDTGANPWMGPEETDDDTPRTKSARAYLAKSESAKKAKKTDKDS